MIEPGHLIGALAVLEDDMSPVDPNDAIIVALELYRRWEIWHQFRHRVPVGDLEVSCDYELEQL